MSEFGISHTAALNEAAVDYSRRPYAVRTGRCDITMLADGSTLMAVIRIDGGDGQLPGAALSRRMSWRDTTSNTH